MAHILSCSGLCKRVPTAEGWLSILSEIYLQVEAGESLAIGGVSGAGKSTLLGLLAGLDVPSAGEIHLAGEPLHAMNEEARAALRARCVGFVFQTFQLLPGLSALENVMLPLELSGANAPRRRAAEFLDRVGLSARLRHYPKQLSGGEQQRVAIARAFASEPQVLFADEPTGNLDAQSGARVAELLFALNREAGATLLLVSHDETLAARCKRRLRLHAGSIAP